MRRRVTDAGREQIELEKFEIARARATCVPEEVHDE